MDQRKKLGYGSNCLVMHLMSILPFNIHQELLACASMSILPIDIKNLNRTLQSSSIQVSLKLRVIIVSDCAYVWLL